MAKKGPKFHRENRFAPTPETLAKLGTDPLKAMLTDDLIDTAGEKAAAEIREIFEAVCAAVMRRPARYGQDFGMPRGVPVELPDAVAANHAGTYLPWVKATGPVVVNATLTLIMERENVGCAMKLKIAEALTDYARRMARRKKSH